MARFSSGACCGLPPVLQAFAPSSDGSKAFWRTRTITARYIARPTGSAAATRSLMKLMYGNERAAAGKRMRARGG